MRQLLQECYKNEFDVVKTSSPNLGNANVLQCCQEVHGYVLKFGWCSSKELCVTKRHFLNHYCYSSCLKDNLTAVQVGGWNPPGFPTTAPGFRQCYEYPWLFNLRCCDMIWFIWKMCGFIFSSSNCMFWVMQLSDVALPPAPQASRKVIWGEGCVGSGPEFPCGSQRRRPRFVRAIDPSWWSWLVSYAGKP